VRVCESVCVYKPARFCFKALINHSLTSPQRRCRFTGTLEPLRGLIGLYFLNLQWNKIGGKFECEVGGYSFDESCFWKNRCW
jgi:hypothetical protein